MSTAIPNKPRIAVLGSININMVVRCDSLPVPGQTIIGQTLIATGDLLMVQLEVPVDVVLPAMEIARENNRVGSRFRCC